MSHAIRRTALTGIGVFVALTVVLSAGPALCQEGLVYTLQVDGLACPFCAYGIEKQVQAIEGVAAVETEIKTGTVTITMVAGATLTEAAARKAVEDAGFTFRGLSPPQGGPE